MSGQVRLRFGSLPQIPVASRRNDTSPGWRASASGAATSTLSNRKGATSCCAHMRLSTLDSVFTFQSYTTMLPYTSKDTAGMTGE
jgi:hypothetical protein